MTLKGGLLYDAPAFLRWWLTELSMSQADFACRMGRPQKTICEILAGKSGMTHEFALHCGYVLHPHVNPSNLMKLQYSELLEQARSRLLNEER
jgi:plasmid maintenance system antidote protein VapI